MKNCTHCGGEMHDEAYICPHCRCATENAPTAPPRNDDKISFLFCLLAALLPIFGYVFWAVKYRETPRRALACGLTAIVRDCVALLAMYYIWILFKI